MITTYLPWIALAVGIAAILSRDGIKPSAADAPPPGAKSPFRSALISLLVLALLALLAGWRWKSAAPDVWPSALGFLFGAFVAAVAEFLGRARFQRGAFIAGPLGVAVAALGLDMVAVAQRLPGHEIGLGLGVAVGAWVLTSLSTGDGWPVRTAIFLNAVLLVDILGALGPGGRAAHGGLALAVAVAFFAAAIPSVLAMTRLEGRSGGAAKIADFALFIAGSSWLIATRYVWLHHVWHLFAAAVVVALVVHWFVSREEQESALPHLLAVVVWLGLATLAFGLLKGYGMAVALLAASAVFLFLDNKPALLSLGPFAVLVAYRVFREMNESASRALDIGQHYSLIGLMAGMALIALALESRRARKESAPASALIAALALAIPVLAATLIGVKGYVGVLVGMGFSFLVVGAPKFRSALPLALQMGVGLLMAGAFGWFEAIIDLSRDQKVRTLIYAVPSVAALVIAILLLTRAPKLAAPEGEPS